MVRPWLALALLAGCSVPDVTFTESGNPDAGPGSDGSTATNHQVAVRWTLNHLESGTLFACPFGTASTSIQVNAWNPETLIISSNTSMFQAPCGNGSQTITLPAGTYALHMLIQDSGGANLLVSDFVFVDTRAGDTTAEVLFYDDAGFFALAWEVLDHAGGTRQTCAAAGIPPNGWFELTSKNTDTNMTYVDKLACDDHLASTQPLPPGAYTFTARGRNAAGTAVTTVATPPSLTLPMNAVIIFRDNVSVSGTAAARN
jgi:hypothetical protein